MSTPSPDAYRDAVVTWQSKIVDHRELRTLAEELAHTLELPGDQRTVVVLGPSGVGKTTLARRLLTMILKDGPTCEPDSRPGAIAAVYVSLHAPETGQFRMGDFYERALTALGDPVVEKRARPVLRLRNAYLTALRERSVRAVLVDEAATLAQASTARSLRDLAEVFKSLGNDTGVAHVLFGTDELQDLLFQTYQLNRRSLVIRFAPYDAHLKEDRIQLASAARALLRHAPLPSDEELALRMLDAFFERTHGCVGSLHQWFLIALWQAPHRRVDALTDAYLLEIARSNNALSDAGAAQAADEAQEGHARFRRGRERETAVSANARARAEGATLRRPGTRRPARDPVGP